MGERNPDDRTPGLRTMTDASTGGERTVYGEIAADTSAIFDTDARRDCNGFSADWVETAAGFTIESRPQNPHGVRLTRGMRRLCRFLPAETLAAVGILGELVGLRRSS